MGYFLSASSMEVPAVEKRIAEFFKIKNGDLPPFRATRSNRTRKTLASLFPVLGYTKGAEIGVCTGVFSEIICTHNPTVDLLCVDPWLAYREIPYQNLMDEYYEAAVKRLARFPGVRIVKAKSVEASREVPDGSLDFVYIDAAHDFDPAMMDIIHWAPKVRSGGIVAGHDYVYAFRCGVIDAVNCYIKAHNISNLYLTGDAQSSWFWAVK